MLQIQWAGEQLCLLPEKASYWPREKTLIVADLHLGKSAAFRKAGLPVPEATTDSDLQRLGKIIRQTECRRLVILGDLFHARQGLQPEMLQTVSRWRESNPLETILIRGNHDKRSGAPPKEWCIHQAGDLWCCPPFVFSHQPQPGSNPFQFSGHVHPAILLRHKLLGSIRAPCFYFGERQAILPAFGSFTGMSNLSPQPGDRFFAIHSEENQIVELS